MSTDAPRPDGSDTGGDDPWAPAAVDPPAVARPRGLLWVAVTLFVIGAIFTVLAAITPFVLGRDAPTQLYLGAMFFMPLGFLLGLVYALRSARAPRV